jgi:hypothetical protein
MQSCGTGTNSRCVFSANYLAEFLLESVYMGTNGGDPVGVKGFFDEHLFEGTHVGCGEEDLFCHFSAKLIMNY